MVPLAVPLASRWALYCMGFTFVFEVFRILIAYIVSKPSDKIRENMVKKAEYQVELSTITAIQVDFVRHSKLTRNIIKLDKEIEQLQGEYAPRVSKTKSVARFIRFLSYGSIGAYFLNTGMVTVDKNIIWPLGSFSNSNLLTLNVFFFLFLCGISWRHILRTCLPLLFRGRTIFP